VTSRNRSLPQIFCIFPRNVAPGFLQYTGERPDVIPHDEGSKMPKTTKGS
jgi:hypothetical protein